MLKRWEKTSCRTSMIACELRFYRSGPPPGPPVRWIQQEVPRFPERLDCGTTPLQHGLCLLHSLRVPSSPTISESPYPEVTRALGAAGAGNARTRTRVRDGGGSRSGSSPRMRPARCAPSAPLTRLHGEPAPASSRPRQHWPRTPRRNWRQTWHPGRGVARVWPTLTGRGDLDVPFVWFRTETDQPEGRQGGRRW
jgi:hypothetical protein